MIRLLFFLPRPSCTHLLIFAVACALSLAGLSASPAQAQEGPQAQQYEDVNWHRVVLIDYKAGKRERALEILDKYYYPAAEKAGVTGPPAIEVQTGPWDLMAIYAMEEGPSEMRWETSPEWAKFQRAMEQMVGSEKARKITEEYSSLVDRRVAHVGFSGRHGRALAGN